MTIYRESFYGFNFKISERGVRANLPPVIDEENLEDICGAPREEEHSLPYGFSIVGPNGKAIESLRKEYVVGQELTSVL